MSSNEPVQVLIVDADNVRRGMLACMLPGTRYALEFAKTPEAGLDALVRLRPEVVMIGHHEPTDICQRIRSLPAGQRSVLVLMSERFRDEAAGLSEAEATGADIALPFPFELQLFERRLRHFKRHHTPQPSPAARPAPATPEQPAPKPPAAAAPEDDPTAAWRSFRERVDQLFDNLDDRDYYELLGVRAGASRAEIKDAYFARSIDFHPDRFVQHEDEELKRRIYEIFKRVTEAFKILLDPDARGEYDEQLSTPAGQKRLVDFSRPPADAPNALAASPAARKYLHFASIAERDGNLKSARMYLTLAVQAEPRNAELRGRLETVTRKLRLT